MGRSNTHGRVPPSPTSAVYLHLLAGAVSHHFGKEGQDTLATDRARRNVDVRPSLFRRRPQLRRGRLLTAFLSRSLSQTYEKGEEKEAKRKQILFEKGTP